MRNHLGISKYSEPEIARMKQNAYSKDKHAAWSGFVSGSKGNLEYFFEQYAFQVMKVATANKDMVKEYHLPIYKLDSIHFKSEEISRQ